MRFAFIWIAYRLTFDNLAVCTEEVLIQSEMSTKLLMSVTKYLLVAVKLITAVFVNINSLLRKTKESQCISDDKISLQAEYICEKYIQYKFSQDGKTTRLLLLQGNPRLRAAEEICSEEVVTTMQKYGGILEDGYPALYSNVTQQLNFRINIDLVVCGVFTCVCDNILASGITWAKIVSMYAFAAALATDCSQNKDLRITRSISRWMGQYTHKRLCAWIREHGGWVSINRLITSKIPIHIVVKTS